MTTQELQQIELESLEVIQENRPPKKRGRRKGTRAPKSLNDPSLKNKKIYFGKEHEDAIVSYTLSTSKKEREKYYKEFIEPAFSEMISKIVFTFRFNLLPNVEELKEECMSWLLTILQKFDPARGSKAFSYFSVITKNFFIYKAKKTVELSKKEISFESLLYEGEIEEDSPHNSPTEFIYENNFLENKLSQELKI